MVGIAGTSSFTFKPMLTPTTTKTALSSLFLYSFELNLCRLRLQNPNFSKPDSFISVPHVFSSSVVTARYGGSRSSRKSGRSDSDVDPALDLSRIKSDVVRLIDENQTMIGLVPLTDASQKAQELELDAVIVSADSEPPVIKIMDYNKYMYETQRKKKGQQRKSAANRMDLKELKMGYNIDQHDYDVRLKAAQKFLKDGHKVKVIVHLKGRENDFRNIAIELIKRFQNDIGELATEESKAFYGRDIFIAMAPKKAVVQKAPELPKMGDNSAVNEVSTPESLQMGDNSAINEVSAPDSPHITDNSTVNEVSSAESPQRTDNAAINEVSAAESPQRTDNAAINEVSAPESPQRTDNAVANEVSASV